MSADLVVEPRLFDSGNRKTIRPSDLEAETLREGNLIEVFSHQLASDKVGWFGHGGYAGDRGRTSFAYGDIVDDAGNPIEAEVHVAFADSDGDDIARRVYADVEDLREAEAEDRTDRPEMPAMATEDGNVAGSDRYLVVYLEAKSDSDEATIDPAASSLKLYYTTN